jgi:hypothetical protein
MLKTIREPSFSSDLSFTNIHKQKHFLLTVFT